MGGETIANASATGVPQGGCSIPRKTQAQGEILHDGGSSSGTYNAFQI
jgi:hypothetical protein